jgi:hypothetical protein
LYQFPVSYFLGASIFSSRGFVFLSHICPFYILPVLGALTRLSSVCVCQHAHRCRFAFYSNINKVDILYLCNSCGILLRLPLFLWGLRRIPVLGPGARF